MNWRLKVAGFKALEWLPAGKELYRFSQRHITRSIQATQTRVAQKVAVGLQYLDRLARHGKAEQLLAGTHLDYGAGWHPTIPLLYYALGLNRQILVDVAPLMDHQLLAETVQIFRSLAEQPETPWRQRLVRLPPLPPNADWRTYLRDLGIAYRAPYEPALSSLAGAADLVTSTQVFPYVPSSGISCCFNHIHHFLRPGGLFVATVHLREMQAGWDQFKFPAKTWERWFNSSLIAYSQLRAPDYRLLLEQARFQILEFEVEPGTAADLAELRRVPLAPCFTRYSTDDLAARHLFFVARKKSSI